MAARRPPKKAPKKAKKTAAKKKAKAAPKKKAPVKAAAKKKAKAKAAPRKKAAPRTKKVVGPIRMKIVWAVCNPVLKILKVFAYPDKKAAEAEAVRLTKMKKTQHKVRPEKVPMED